MLAVNPKLLEKLYTNYKGYAFAEGEEFANFKALEYCVNAEKYQTANKEISFDWSSYFDVSNPPFYLIRLTLKSDHAHFYKQQVKGLCLKESQEQAFVNIYDIVCLNINNYISFMRKGKDILILERSYLSFVSNNFIHCHN